MKLDTKETTEALAAAFALTKRYTEAMADGKLGYVEMAGFLREAPGVRLAVEGVEKIPAELLDLDNDELPLVITRLSNVLNAWGVSHRTQDITGEVARAAAVMVPTAQTLIRQVRDLAALINDQPPVALPVEDFTREQLGA